MFLFKIKLPICMEKAVKVSSRGQQAVYVRFGRTESTIPNLFNKEGLPAAWFCSETEK